MKRIFIAGVFILFTAIVQAQNVGIGTTTPAAKLNIIGAGSSPSIPGATTSTAIFRIGMSPNEGIDFGKLSSAPFSAWIQSGSFNVIQNPISLQPLGGNVGIGILSPAYRFQVDDPVAANNYMNISNSTTGNSANDGLLVGLTGNSAILANLENGSLKLGTNNLTRIMIDAGGDVGIGTLSPLAKLHVNGTIKIEGLNTLEFGAGLSKEINAGKIGYQTYTPGALDIVGAGTTVATRKVNFFAEGGTTFNGPATISGNVGVGILSPASSAMLDVSSTTQGFLPPRMTAAQRTSIANPANGLIVYCIDCGGGQLNVYNYSSTSWTNMIGGAAAAVTPPLAIGQDYGGGKIAYILVSGDPGYDTNVPHGLIAAASDQSTAAQWGCNGIAIPGADGTALGTGNQNTIDIMAGCTTAGIAARLCGDLVLNGFSDWYLPSQDELNKLHINQVAVGGFVLSNYWSSSETNLNNALYQNFFLGTENTNVKNVTYRVRAVRAF